MREMIALGWTPGSFDDDFDMFVEDSDELQPDEKEDCKVIFNNVWEQKLEEAPYTVILRCSALSDVELRELILNCYIEHISQEEYEDVHDRIVSKVNELLPEYMEWNPYTSEVIGKAIQTYTEEEFKEVLEDVFEEVIGY